MDAELFSVWLFFPEGSSYCEQSHLGAEAAFRLAKEVTKRPAAMIGMITRIIITDGGDCTVFEWRHGQGVTFK